MLGIEEFSRVVSGIHVAAGRPETWGPTFADLAAAMDATSCSLAINTTSGSRTLISTTISHEAVQSYGAHFQKLDFIAGACEKGPVGLVRTGFELVAANRRTEFHADWQLRYEMADGLFVRLPDTSATTCFFVSAPMRDDPFASAERVRFVNALVPHLQLALSTKRLLRDADPFTAAVEHSAGLHAALDAVRHGLVVVGPDGRIRAMNAAAEAIARAADGLRVRGEKLSAVSVSRDDELQGALSRALRTESSRPREGSHMVCERTSGQRAYVLRIVPLGNGDDASAAEAAVVIVDLARQLAPPEALVQRVFGLTDAETYVVMRVADGASLQSIAADRGLSMATIKTHLQHVFGKTGTHRQADLVRLLSQIGH